MICDSLHENFILFLCNVGGISVSGTAFDCWTQAENSTQKAKQLGALMGCPTNNVRDMVRCLRYRPGRVMVQALGEFMVIILHL